MSVAVVSVPRRKLLLALASVTGVALLAVPASAGSYLTRAALLLSGARREGEVLRQHFADKELARTIHRLARARMEAAASMLVPKDVVQAHPHLLLVLEHHERACDAAEKGEPERFLIALQRALDEDRTFRAVLKQFGWELPEAKR